jgi:hypothetical protein
LRGDDQRVDLNEQKKQFSGAYLRAVASAAGYAAEEPSTDDDSVDFTIRSRLAGTAVRSPSLDVQLKCTADDRGATPMPFELKRKNYVELHGEDFQSPRLLVVVFVPSDCEQWLGHSESRLEVYHCAYWVSLRQAPAISGDAHSKMVYVPREQQFTVDQLRTLMVGIGNGVRP